MTDAELRIMNVLWQRQRATVGEVVECLVGPRKPAYNTVLTVLRILERKAFVSHEKAGRAFTWAPLVNRGDAQRSALSHLLSRFFDGSPELLVLNLLGQDDAHPDEVLRIRELIANSPPQPRPDQDRGDSR